MQEGPYTWDENGNRVPLTVQQAERINRTPEGAGESPDQTGPILSSQYDRRSWKRILKFWSPGKPTDGRWFGDWIDEHGLPLGFIALALIVVVVMVVRLVQSFL